MVRGEVEFLCVAKSRVELQCSVKGICGLLCTTHGKGERLHLSEGPVKYLCVTEGTQELLSEADVDDTDSKRIAAFRVHFLDHLDNLIIQRSQSPPPPQCKISR